MENLKKVISLSQASKITGYHSDYLSALIRKGEIKGEKIGGNWFTSEEEIKNYIFKQKIRHKKLALGGFFSQKRTKNIFIFTAVLFISIILVSIYFYDKNSKATLIESKKALSTEIEVIK
jgi:hypothetical protein